MSIQALLGLAKSRKPSFIQLESAWLEKFFKWEPVSLGQTIALRCSPSSPLASLRRYAPQGLLIKELTCLGC